MDSLDVPRQNHRKPSKSNSSKDKSRSSSKHPKRPGSTASEGGRRRKSRHHQSTNVMNAFDYMVLSEEPARGKAAVAKKVGSGLDSSSASDDSDAHLSASHQAKRKGTMNASRIRGTVPSVSSILATVGHKGGDTNYSNESSSTLTQSSYDSHNAPTESVAKAETVPKPDPLAFLDADSPAVTQDTIYDSMHTASSHSPTSSISGSSFTKSYSSKSSHDTDWNTTPERSPKSGKVDKASAKMASQTEASQKRQRKYGNPEMSRGNAKLPHVSSKASTPRVPDQAHGRVKHLPRAEKLPLTGYELLASRLTAHSADRSGPYVRPIYRKFETLNHRLLLHLQDELCELEEQLHRLDSADTQNRRLQNRILPASRRAQTLSGGELQWHKTDILGKIGFKLEQYNHVLSSFKTTQTLPNPTLVDVHEYRRYLATHGPITEAETHFLDAANDLICLDQEVEDDYDEDSTTTPMPPRSPGNYTSMLSNSSVLDDDDEERQHAIPLSLAMAAAVILPVLTFTVIPGYIGRMAVVLVVSFVILGTLISAGVVGLHITRDFFLITGFYGLGMAVIAGLW